MLPWKQLGIRGSSPIRSKLWNGLAAGSWLSFGSQHRLLVDTVAKEYRYRGVTDATYTYFPWNVAGIRVIPGQMGEVLIYLLYSLAFRKARLWPEAQETSL